MSLGFVACARRSITRGSIGDLYDGLDTTTEVDAIEQQGLGETVLLWNDSRLEGFAACHIGPNTEAGSGACYINVLLPAARRRKQPRAKHRRAATQQYRGRLETADQLMAIAVVFGGA